MKEIIEIVFEKVHLEKVVELLKKLLDSSTLRDYHISTDKSDVDLNLQSQELLFTDINQSSDGSFYFNFLNFTLTGVLLSRVGFQVYKYDNIYDLNLHIGENEIKRKSSVSELQKWAESIAEELKAEDYYCGFEPAIDEETRLFSGNILGPLKISN